MYVLLYPSVTNATINLNFDTSLLAPTTSFKLERRNIVYFDWKIVRRDGAEILLGIDWTNIMILRAKDNFVDMS